MTANARHAGLSLVELLVSLALASLMMIAISELYVRSKVNMNTAQQLAEVRENARYALQIIAADLRRAGFLGEARPPTGPLLLGDLALSLDCAKTAAWGRAVHEAVAGLNDATKDLQRDYRGCIPGSDYLRGDVLAVRYAAPLSDTPWRRAVNAQAPYLFASLEQPRILLGKEVNGALARDPGTSVYALSAAAYHIAPAEEDQNLCGSDDYPALVRRGLDNRGLPRREEITEGIENLQIRIGVDTNSDGIVDSYREPNETRPEHTILAVRIWLLARARCAEIGYVNRERYEFADQILVPNDHYRRELTSTTIALRGIHGIYLP